MNGTSQTAFVSYVREHRDQIDKLVSLLSVVGKTWWDRNIPPGAKWRDVLQQQIVKNDVLVVFWCSHAAESTWVEREIDLASELGKPIVPVRLDRTPLSPVLADYQAINLDGVVVHTDGDPHHDPSSHDHGPPTTGSAPDADTPPAPRRWRWIGAAGGTTVLLAAVLTVAVWPFSADRAPDDPIPTSAGAEPLPAPQPIARPVPVDVLDGLVAADEPDLVDTDQIVVLHGAAVAQVAHAHPDSRLVATSTKRNAPVIKLSRDRWEELVLEGALAGDPDAGGPTGSGQTADDGLRYVAADLPTEHVVSSVESGDPLSSSRPPAPLLLGLLALLALGGLAGWLRWRRRAAASPRQGPTTPPLQFLSSGPRHAMPSMTLTGGPTVAPEPGWEDAARALDAAIAAALAPAPPGADEDQSSGA